VPARERKPPLVGLAEAYRQAMAFDDRVLDAARRVLAQYETLRERADAAMGDWVHNATVSNAIRRDDTSRTFEAMQDAAIVAQAVVDQAAEDARG
jgi:hypothetical protein